MAFRLTKEESFSDGIRRIVIEQLTKAADQLSNPKKVDRGVHEARRSIKKVRGVLRLIQPEMRTVCRAENGQLRTLSRRLACLRDDAVMPEVFDSVLPKRDRRFRSVREGLEKSRQDTKRAGNVGELFQETMLDLRAVMRRVEDWPIPNSVDEVLASGFEDTYQRGKAALLAAIKQPVPENWHRLRKRVKEHRFHLTILSLVEEESKRMQDLRRLEVLLGDAHNITVLCERLEENATLYGGPENVTAFQALLDSKQQQLQTRALPLSQRLYAMEEARS